MYQFGAFYNSLAVAALLSWLQALISMSPVIVAEYLPSTPAMYHPYDSCVYAEATCAIHVEHMFGVAGWLCYPF